MLEITGGIGDFGDIRWELVGTTLLSWVIVFFCLFKGIKSSGKVKCFLVLNNDDSSTIKPGKVQNELDLVSEGCTYNCGLIQRDKKNHVK